MRYVSILHGINVGGHKIIKMDDLKALFETLGFRDVVTYIQSGNVIFDSAVKNRAELKEKIEDAIEKRFKFHVPVQIRTNREIGDIIKNCPFGSVDLQKDGTKVSVTFLSAKPSEVRVSDIQRYVLPPEKLFVRGKEVYLYCPIGCAKTKLSITFIEKKLGIEATARNWKSVIKLHELSVE